VQHGGVAGGPPNTAGRRITRLVPACEDAAAIASSNRRQAMPKSSACPSTVGVVSQIS
jgi:hypothetical protein